MQTELLGKYTSHNERIVCVYNSAMGYAYFITLTLQGRLIIRQASEIALSGQSAHELLGDRRKQC